MKRIIVYLNQQSKFSLWAWSFSLVILLGLIEYRANPDLSFSAFYLIPIFIATWFVGQRAGNFTASASAILWFVAELFAKHPDANRMIPYWNVTVNLAFFLAFTHLLINFKKSLEHERELARTDTLTGLANRRSFLELSHLEMSRARRYKRPFTLVYFDLDHFKLLNDRLGHAAGDTFLGKVGTILRHNVRTPDIVARMGGDEFAVFLPETNYKAADSVVQRLWDLILKEARESTSEVTLSIGMVTCESPERISKGLDDVIQMADRLMYEVKQSGRNHIRHERFEMASAIRSDRRPQEVPVVQSRLLA